MLFKFKIWKWSLQSFFWIEDLLLHETIFLRVLNNARACQDFEFFSLKSELFSSTEERKARNCQLLRKESEVLADFFGSKFENVFFTSLANTLFHIYLSIHSKKRYVKVMVRKWQFGNTRAQKWRFWGVFGFSKTLCSVFSVRSWFVSIPATAGDLAADVKLSAKNPPPLHAPGPTNAFLPNVLAIHRSHMCP